MQQSRSQPFDGDGLLPDRSCGAVHPGMVWRPRPVWVQPASRDRFGQFCEFSCSEGKADLMHRFALRDRNTRVPRSSGDVEVRDCPICRAEDAVIIPSEFGSEGGEVALIHDREIASTRQVLCRHCRKSLTAVPMVGAECVT